MRQGKLLDMRSKYPLLLEKLADESAFDEIHFARPLFDTARLKCRGMVEEGPSTKLGGFVSAITAFEFLDNIYEPVLFIQQARFWRRSYF